MMDPSMMPPAPPMMGGPAPAPGYPGARQAMMAHADAYIGLPELNDILGIGQEGDYLGCEEEYGGVPVPLSSYYGGDDGAYGPDMGMEMGMPPVGDDAAEGMRDLLAERAKARLAASENFQQSAGKMMGGL